MIPIPAPEFRRLCLAWGFEEDRQGGNHELLRWPATGKKVPLRATGDVNDYTANQFASLAEVPLNKFLAGPVKEVRPRRFLVTAPRKKILKALAAQGGSVEDANGRATFHLLKTWGGEGERNQRSLVGLLSRMDAEGQIVRTTKGKRTYRISIALDGPYVREMLNSSAALVEEASDNKGSRIRHAIVAHLHSQGDEVKDAKGRVAKLIADAIGDTPGRVGMILTEMERDGQVVRDWHEGRRKLLGVCLVDAPEEWKTTPPPEPEEKEPEKGPAEPESAEPEVPAAAEVPSYSVEEIAAALFNYTVKVISENNPERFAAVITDLERRLAQTTEHAESLRRKLTKAEQAVIDERQAKERMQREVSQLRSAKNLNGAQRGAIDSALKHQREKAKT